MGRRGGHHHTASRFLDLDLAQNIDSPAIVRAAGMDVSGIGGKDVVPDERTYPLWSVQRQRPGGAADRPHRGALLHALRGRPGDPHDPAHVGMILR